MESIAKKRFTAYVKIPNEFRTLLEQKDIKFSFNLDSKSSSFSILALSNQLANKKFSGTLSEIDNIYHFSLSTHKEARFNGKIQYRSSIFLDSLKPEDFPKIASNDENKPKIIVDESLRPIKTPFPFKLHTDHKLLTCINQDNAAWNTVKKEYGIHRKRENRDDVIKSLKTLYSNQKYWRIKDLADETSQPENFIREIMRSLGQKVTTGEHRGLWQLCLNNN